MEITQENIIDTINKMILAGKSLPQKDRIRSARNPEEEQQKVLVQTAKLWWDLFSKQHISVDRWEQATDRALILNGIARLETSVINPALMSVALVQIEKEYLEAQQVKYEQEKQEELNGNPYPFPEMGKLISYHLRHHRKPLIPLPEEKTVRAWALKGGWSETTIENNMIKLRIYYVYGLYAKRDKTKMPIKLVLNDRGIANIEFAN